MRAAWTNDTGARPGCGRGSASMGVLGVLAPEADGGLGLDDVDLVLLLEETGRAALPEPVVEHAAVGVPLLADATCRGGRRRRRDRHGRRSAIRLVLYADTADLVLLGDRSRRAAARCSCARHESVDGIPAPVRGRVGRPADRRRGALAPRFDRGALGHRRAARRPRRPHARR